MTIGGRLKSIRKALGLNQEQLATSLGFGQSYISSIERDEKDLSRDIISKLIEVHNIDSNWLLTGKGSMFLDAAAPSPSVPGAQDLKIVHPDELGSHDFLVPLLTQRISAGGGNELSEADEVRALIPAPKYLSRFGRNIAALQVTGDSMEPTLRNGDLIICDTFGWQEEGIYVIQLNDQAFIKRLSRSVKEYVIISDNKNYPVIREPLESQEVRIVGKVRCAVRSME
jgi:phage repressor protein C with HTH and peptisase S24 domain